MNNNPKDYSSNIKLLMKGIREAKDWLIHFKFLVVIAYILRSADKRLAGEVTAYLLSTIPRPPKCTSKTADEV